MSQTISKETKVLDTPSATSYAAVTDTTLVFDNSGAGVRTLEINNISTDATATCTVDSITASDQGQDNDISATIPPATIKVFGPVNQRRFNNGDDIVTAVLSTTTDVSAAVVQLPVV